MIEHCTAIGARFKVIDMPVLAICAVCGSYGVEGVDACGHGDAGRDDLGRLPGEALWPEVRDRQFLLSQRRTVGSRQFDALFQARPRAEEGTVFLREHFRYATLEDDRRIIHLQAGTRIALRDCRVFSMCDLAFTQNASSDFFALGTFAIAPTRDLVVLDVVRAKCSMQQQLQLVKNALAKWPIARVGIEVVGPSATSSISAWPKGCPSKKSVRRRPSKCARTSLRRCSSRAACTS